MPPHPEGGQKTLMVQGTLSNAGKSWVTTGICRILKRQGIKVAPFKPQNMSLNSAPTEDGGEIGRAQALQAQACGIPPLSHMNPVLLKPNNHLGSQVIVQGQVWKNMSAQDYHGVKPQLLSRVLESHAYLCQHYDYIVAEGAGSPAEINLREGDIANMGFAEAVDCPVILVGDIDRGGVFAQFVGTLALLSPSERQRIKGLIINRFRGDKTLLNPGIQWLEQHTGIPVLGVLPYCPDIHLDAEDSLAAFTHTHKSQTNIALRIVVIQFPRLSNNTDFEPLAQVPELQVDFCQTPNQGADLLILPGSKNVMADLAWLRDQGWESYITRHLRYGGKMLGICGGFQMLGRHISDPQQVESETTHCPGLAYFDMETVLESHKQLREVKGMLSWAPCPIQAYEIHMGRSNGPALAHPMARLDTGPDGAISPDNHIMGTYLHGLFDTAPALKHLLAWAGFTPPVTVDFAALREQNLERLADQLEQHLDWKNGVPWQTII